MEIKRLVVGSLKTNCYLLFSGNSAAVIDPGADSELILKELKNKNVDLGYIINTHYHPDHIGADMEIKKATGAKILMHQAEKSFVDFEVDQFLADNDIIKIGDIKLTVVHTPGHTAGGICLAGEDCIFTGDTLFMDGCGRTDLPGGSEQDLEHSLELLYMIIKPGMMVYPGHGDYFEF